MSDRSLVAANRLRAPIMVAAALVIPVTIVEASHPGQPLEHALQRLPAVGGASDSAGRGTRSDRE